MQPVPVPEFVERNPEQVTRDLIAQFEAATGRTLHPAQVERVLIDLFAYRESLLRIAIQEAATQNLVAFARYPMLDFLGEIVGTTRIPGSAATTTLRFTLVAAQVGAVVVPAGTRVRTTDGLLIFATDHAIEIPAGSLSGDVRATAAAVGEVGNGYPAGGVSVLLDPVAFVAGASNLGTTTGGAEVEPDDRFRARVKEAPNQFSVAGSAAAYRYHAMSVSSTIIDVAVTSPVPGTVRLYVLTDTGIPSAELLEDVAAAVSGDEVRPLSDTVEVEPPTEVPYQIEATVRLNAGVHAASTLDAVQAAAEAYVEDRRAGLGCDIVPSQIIAALSVAGVYDVQLEAPAYRELGSDEWANCTSITITQGPSAHA